MTNFAKVLKWDSDEPRGGNGRWRSAGDFSDSYDDDSAGYDLPPARFRGAPKEPDYEETAHRAPKKFYRTDPKDIAGVFQSFKNDGGLMEAHPTEMARKWKEVMGGVHPHDVLRAFMGKDGLSNHNFSQLAINIDVPSKRVSIATHGDESDLDVHGAKALSLARYIHMGEPKFAEHSMLKLADENQGGGVVKKMFKECLPLYDKLGVKTVTLHANIDMGAYAWAKYGFEYFDTGERKQHQQQMKDTLLKHTQGITLNQAEREEKEAISKALEAKSAKGVWHLADMKTPHLDKKFKVAIGKSFKKKGSFIKLLFKGTDGKGSSWTGKLSLDGKTPARARLGKYLEAA